MQTPFWYVVIGLIVYALAFWVYGKWYDRNVWKPDPKRATPAHMYMDGVEFFPVSRYVLWGYQFKSVAALGPILGPFVAIQYGWLPAAIWIILGNFFIGWLQDYGAIMVSVRNEGRSFGPISYEFTGAKGRDTLLGFILFYLIIISATFIFLIATFWNIFPGTFVATAGVVVTGLIAGHLIYKVRANIVGVTVLCLVLIVVSIILGNWLTTTPNFAGAWTLPFWAVVAGIFLYAGAILPLPSFIQPINYVAFFPCYVAVLLIIIGSLLSPVTGVPLLQPAWKAAYTPVAGPIWPIIFVAIACGAISGWHSLVGSSSTGKQLDIETDAHPIGAGAMLSEGLLALASLAAYMVLLPAEMGAVKGAPPNIGGWVFGATKLSSPWLGGQAVVPFLMTYFGLSLVLYAITVQALVTRFWRLVSAEVFGERVLGQKHVATFVGLLIPVIFAITGSWMNLWLYFGGANQLLAGLALMLITIHLARAKSPTKFTLIPATFMIITTLAAIAWVTVMQFGKALWTAKPLVGGPPLSLPAYKTLALTLNGVFILFGVALFFLGLRMAIQVFQAYGRFKAAAAMPEAARGRA